VEEKSVKVEPVKKVIEHKKETENNHISENDIADIFEFSDEIKTQKSTDTKINSNFDISSFISNLKSVKAKSALTMSLL